LFEGQWPGKKRDNAGETRDEDEEIMLDVERERVVGCKVKQ